MKQNILEELKKHVRPGSKELAELNKLIDDLSVIRDTMIDMQKLLIDLEFREGYHLENKQLKLKIEIAEEMYPEQMKTVNTAIQVMSNMKGNHGK